MNRPQFEEFLEKNLATIRIRMIRYTRGRVEDAEDAIQAAALEVIEFITWGWKFTHLITAEEFIEFTRPFARKERTARMGGAGKRTGAFLKYAGSLADLDRVSYPRRKDGAFERGHMSEEGLDRDGNGGYWPAEEVIPD